MTELLALQGDGSELLFRSALLLKGDPPLNNPGTRIYRHENDGPQLVRQSGQVETFLGAYLSTDGETSAEFCTQAEGIIRPISYSALCVNKRGKREVYPGADARLSRNGRFAYLRNNQALLYDLEAAQSYPLPSPGPLHGHNALSDNGTLVSHFLGSSGTRRTNTVALARPDQPQRLIFEGASVGFAGISADGHYVFLREDLPDGESRLIEIDLQSLAKRTIFQTQNDRFYFYISGNGDRVLIRYYQALSVWERGAAQVRRIADSEDLILSALISDDGNTVAYQKSDGAIHRIAGPGLDRDEEIYPPTPNLLTPQEGSTYAGSAAFFASRGFQSDTALMIEGLPAPILRLDKNSILSQELLLQVPWELTSEISQVELRASATNSPFEFRTRLRFTTQATAAFYNYRDPGAGSFVVSATNEDFSALISSLNPARAGTFVHVYLGGLGALDQPIRTGEVGPFDPPAKPLTGIRCELRNLDINSPAQELDIPSLVYAPGLVGVYQADMRIPKEWPGGYNALRCQTPDGRGNETRIYTSPA